MVRRNFVLCSILLGIYSLTLFAQNKHNFISVAQTGSADFQTIQAAINSCTNDSVLTVISIGAGVYNEKVFISSNNLVLRGVHKDSVRIEFAELRKNWRKEHDSDYGSAVLNIAPQVENLTIHGLTIHNTYGSQFGNTDHQFAVRGGGTKIIILQSSIIADGGDALSLWNAFNGMYYHADCYFEGYVDFVCPRGWCFIENSSFFGRNLSASIWMDGDHDPDQKFVIKNCDFDGVPGFPLGRHHREAAFYLVGCKFSKNMADKPIYFCGPSPIKLLNRYYYASCTRDEGNYAWFADNLDTAPGNPKLADINPAFVFGDRWNPLEEIRQMQKSGILP